jgi:hypothetical protein
MAKDVADLVRKFEASANLIPPTVADQTLKGAQRVKALYLAGAQRAGLTPGKKMNVGKKGARWGVRYDHLKSSEAKEEVIVRFTGPVHLVNNDTSPHRILTAAGKAAEREQARTVIQALTKTKVRRARTASGPRALALPTGPVASANHPGTQGKDFFKPADDLARTEVKRIVGDTHRIYLTRGGFGRN